MICLLLSLKLEADERTRTRACGLGHKQEKLYNSWKSNKSISFGVMTQNSPATTEVQLFG